jgi:hypothetical protein
VHVIIGKVRSLNALAEEAHVKDSVFLLVNETAELLQVSPNTVRAWAAAGKLRE